MNVVTGGVADGSLRGVVVMDAWGEPTWRNCGFCRRNGIKSLVPGREYSRPIFRASHPACSPLHARQWLILHQFHSALVVLPSVGRCLHVTSDLPIESSLLDLGSEL